MWYSGLLASVVAVLSCSAGVAQAQGLAGAPGAETSGAVTNQYPAARDFPGGVRGLTALAYAPPTGARRHTLDLYLPPSSKGGHPVAHPLVMFVRDTGDDVRHGDAMGDTADILASLAARGYVVASLDFQPEAGARFPAQIEDFRAGLRWLRANAARFDIDPQRALAWGVSAGGHLAALAAVSCHVDRFGPFQSEDASVALPGSDCVQGAVAWSGIFDLGTISAQAAAIGLHGREGGDSALGQWLGCAEGSSCAAQMNGASPVTYVSGATPPMLLLAGDADASVPYQQTRQMGDCLTRAGVRHEVYLLHGADHALAGASAEATRKAREYALKLTFRFIDATLGAVSHS